MNYIISSTLLTNSNLHELENWLIKQENSIQLDIETDGLDPYTSKIHTIQFGNKINERFLVDLMYVDIKEVFKLMSLVNDKIKWVIHNANFEYKMLKVKGFELKSIYCTMLAEKILYQGYGPMISYSLEALCKRYLKKELKKDTRQKFLLPNFVLGQDTIEYALEDVTYLHQIAELQLEKIKKLNLNTVLKIEFNTMFALADIELNGFAFNKELWLEKDKIRREKFNILEAKLDEILASITNKYNLKYIQTSFFEDVTLTARKVNINWGSNQQVLELFNSFNLYPQNKDKKYSVDEYALTKLLKEDLTEHFRNLVTTLLDYREVEKQISTYGKNFVNNFCRDYKDGRGLRAYTSFNQIVSTGRVSSGNKKSGTYNAQNIPQSKEFRECFIATKGRRIITCDYSGQETLIIADMANETSMIDFIMNQKGDMHSWVGSKMYSKKLGKEVIVSKTENEDIRNKAKSLGFLINYGGSSFALAGKLDISNEEGEELINMYFDTFPALKKYHDTAKKEALKNGFILINRVSGRKAFIPEYAEFLKLKAINYDDRNQEDTRRFYKLKGAIEREAVNYKIQGTAADQTKMALIKIRNYIKSNNIDALIVSVIHDEIVVDAEESIAEELAKTVSELMREAGNLFVTKVDMVSTPKIENTWVK